MALFFKASTAAATAVSIPRRIPIGFAPAVTFLIPSRTIAWVKTVAVVVPSPAISLVLEATSDTNLAPIFSKWSSNSISLAMVTPSLVIKGEPNDFSRTTLRPFGPKVTLTVSARISTPRTMAERASDENLISFDILTFSFYSSMIAKMLASPTMMYFSSPSLTSRPAWASTKTRSPVLTLGATKSPFKVRTPCRHC
ncbi:Uncharacterised protein [Streptococcus pneumoniae]|nr:Uncharacterised protein [Streptococcus pneumoniae]